MTSIDPFFIVGVHRSGTTLLRYMFSSSPRLYVPPESDFIPYFFLRNPHATLTEERVARMLNIIFSRYRFVREWEGAPPDPAAFFRSMPAQTPAAFLDSLYGRYAHQHNALRWGDKTPIYSSYLSLIDQIFPRAKFIHIIRDGRDVALSMLDKWGHKEIHVDIYFAARNWTRRIQHARAAAARLGPNRFHELHYEQLVQDPEPHLRQLCDFLGEPYTPQMAAPHRLARQEVAEGSFHAPVRRPPSAKRIGRWRDEMTAPDLRLFQRSAGAMLVETGYDLADAGSMGAAENGRYLALAAKYKTLQAGRRLLQALNLKPPI